MLAPLYLLRSATGWQHSTNAGSSMLEYKLLPVLVVVVVKVVQGTSCKFSSGATAGVSTVLAAGREQLVELLVLPMVVLHSKGC